MPYPRVDYEMTEAELEELLEACKPVPYMVIGGCVPSSPQENANRAWQKLGDKHGFDHMTVQPIHGKGQRFFSAVPTETEFQREERLKRESEEDKQRRIEKLKQKIEAMQQELKVLLSQPKED